MWRSDEGCGYSVVKVTIRLWRDEVGKCTALRRAHHQMAEQENAVGPRQRSPGATERYDLV